MTAPDNGDHTPSHAPADPMWSFEATRCSRNTPHAYARRVKLSTAVTDTFHRFVMDAARWVRPEDVADPSEVNPAVALKLLYRHPPLRAMAWFRLATLARSLGVRGVPDYLQHRLLRLYGLELVPGAEIGGGLYIAHPVGCTLVVESIGCNVSIMGANTFGRRTELRWPVIGERVFIGTGARVLGGVKIGDDAVVGANAVVLIDVPAGARAVGVPARVS